jgi:broad specificity phosphatase PhoE
VGNRAERIRGDDHGLTPAGAEQAKRLGTVARDLEFERLIASDLQRARETVTIAFGEQASPRFDDRWRERDIGDLDGLDFEAAREALPGLFDITSDAAFRTRPPGGESLADVADRLWPALDEVMSSSSQHVVVVAHGGPIRLAACHLLGLDPSRHHWRFVVDNTSLSRFESVDGHVNLTAWNDTHHLIEPPASIDRNTWRQGR